MDSTFKEMSTDEGRVLGVKMKACAPHKSRSIYPFQLPHPLPLSLL